MPSTYSEALRLELQTTGENRSTWGTRLNTVINLIEDAVTGILSIAMSDANKTLTELDGNSDESRNASLVFTGTLTADRTIIIPTTGKMYYIKNSTTGGFGLVISNGTNTVTIPNGDMCFVHSDGTTILKSLDVTGRYFSAYGLTLVDDADAATARTTLGAQASDATLTSLSGLSLAEGDMLYATAADTLARLPKGTAAQVLTMNAGATAPEWVATGDIGLPDRLGITGKFIADWNTATENGFYTSGRKSPDGVTHSPADDNAGFDGHYWHGVTTVSQVGFIYQEVTSLNGMGAGAIEASFCRWQFVGVWGQWKRRWVSQDGLDTRYAQLAAGNIFTGYFIAKGGLYIDSVSPAVVFRDATGNVKGTVYASVAGEIYLYGSVGFAATGGFLYQATDGYFYIGGGSSQAGHLITTGNIASYLPASQTNEGLAHDAIGQYCFASTSTPATPITPGSTYAGSSLRAAGYNAYDNITQPRMEKSATALTGTWRALGYAPAVVSWYSVAMFVRIS